MPKNVSDCNDARSAQIKAESQPQVNSSLDTFASHAALSQSIYIKNVLHDRSSICLIKWIELFSSTVPISVHFSSFGWNISASRQL